MTCRSEVLEAFEDLHREAGRYDFSPAEVLRHLRNRGSTYQDSTIRTHVVAHMTEDGTLIRSGPGRYRLSRHRHHPVDQLPAPAIVPGERLTEDEIKAAVKQHLEEQGWTVRFAWGGQHGVDIEANRDGQRLLLEAKGEAPAGPQQVNYFLGAIGELVQRMSDADARYGLALPDHRQYRGLVERLPAVARERLRLVVYFVERTPGGEAVVTVA